MNKLVIILYYIYRFVIENQISDNKLLKQTIDSNLKGLIKFSGIVKILLILALDVYSK